MNLSLPVILAACCGAMSVVVGGMLVDMQRQGKIKARVRALHSGGAEPSPTANAGSLVTGMVEAIGLSLARTRVISAKTIADLEQTLTIAGFRGDRALHVFLGAKLALIAGLPLVVLLGARLLAPQTAAHDGTMLFAGSALVGLLAPDAVIKNLRKRYLKQLQNDLPDAFDLMVICAEAGLSLEAAMERVAAGVRPPPPSSP